MEEDRDAVHSLQADPASDRMIEDPPMGDEADPHVGYPLIEEGGQEQHAIHPMESIVFDVFVGGVQASFQHVIAPLASLLGQVRRPMWLAMQHT